MISSLVSGLLYSVNRRAVLEVFPPRLRKLWKDWDLRVAVLISLFLQIVLTVLGNRRKSNGKVWIRAIVWSAYTAADMVAIFALGIISNKLSDEFDGKGSLGPNLALTTLWAQFLFLHLGGPDSITAYALQDNELWMRQAFGLVIQTCGAAYIFLLAFTGKNLGLSILSLFIFVAGFIKYGERAWTLKAASEQLQRSSLLKNLANSQTVCRGPNVADADYNLEETKLLAADSLLDGTRRLFVDASLSPEQSRYMRETSKKLSAENAFQICEIQLGMMYDLLYSKGLLVCVKKGVSLRVITFFVSCFSIVFFLVFLDHKHPWSKIDHSITYVLLIVSVLLEIYAALNSLSSDWFLVWLAKKGIKVSKLKTLYPFLPFRIPRWSNKVTQYTLIKRLYKSRPVLLCTSFLGTEKFNQWNTPVHEELRKMIFNYLEKKANELGPSEGIKDNPFTTLPKTDSEEEKLQEVEDQLPAETIEAAEGQLNRTTEFEYKIVIWAIATEVLYYLMKKKEEDMEGVFLYRAKAIKGIARYMLYLLAKHPSMLSAQADIMNPSFQDITNASFFKRVKQFRLSPGWEKKAVFCEKLVERFDKKQSICSVEGIVIYKAMKIVFNKNKKVRESDMWDKLGDFWLEMMAYSATRCPVKVHAQMLRYGGEFLTHIWLLMAHFGLTHHHFQSRKVGGLKFITDQNKPRFVLTEQCKGIHFVGRRKEELYQRFPSNKRILNCATFGDRIGLYHRTNEFSDLLFRTLARKQSIKGEEINREQFHQLCDQIVHENCEHRLKLFVDMMDVDGDGKISQGDIEEIIRVSAEANSLRHIEEKAKEYAGSIMERFDPDKEGCITKVEELQNMLRNMPGLIKWLDREEEYIDEESNLLRKWYQNIKRFCLNIRRQSWMFVLWFGIVTGLFTYKYVQYQNKTAVYNVMGHCICIAKGAAETLKFNMALMLLPFCSRITPWLQSKCNLFGVLVSFNNNLKLHLVIIVGVALGVVLHSIAYLSCAFPRVIHATKEEYEPIKPYFGKKQPENYWWFLKGVEGVTGIMMAIALVLAVCISVLRRSQMTNRKWVFWFSQYLCVTLYVILIVHGLYLHLIKAWYEKTIWIYLTAPIFLYICEWLIRILNITNTITSCKITIYKDIMALHMPKPSNFKFERGQYMLVSCPAVSPFEWYPLYITSAPQENCLSFHVFTQNYWNNWSSQLKAVLCGKENLDSSETVITAEQTKTKRFPKMKMDGPYGAPTQAYKRYDVVLLIGEGMGVLPMMSIIHNILANENKDIESGNRKKVYFYWKIDREIQWMNEMINQIVELDERGMIKFHCYYSGIDEGDASSAMIWLVQYIVHDKTGMDVVSNSSLKSHLGNPNWFHVFESIALRHTDTKVGVFYCGAVWYGVRLKKRALEVSEKTTFHFDFYSEIDKQQEIEG